MLNCLGATLFGIFTSVANAGSPVALTKSEMDAVTAGVGFTSNTPAVTKLVMNIEELIIEEKMALFFPSYSAMEEYLQTINLSEITESIAVTTTGSKPYDVDVIDRRLDY